MNGLKWVFAFVLIISLAGAAYAQVDIPNGQAMDNQTEMEENVTPSINVTDQTVVGNETIGNITIDEVVSDGPGWVGIHNSLFGTLGGVVGFAPVESGTNQNVTVTIDTMAATDSLIAELHQDLGQQGVFEYPAIDVPQMINGEPVSANFSATAEDFMLKNLTDLADEQTMDTGNQTMS
jgi:hypothetical protein